MPSADWGIPEEGRALASSLDSAGIEKAHLAGWSMGATIVLDFAMAHPERVLSLTLVEPQVWWLLRAQAKLVDVMRTHVERFRAFTQIPITVGVLAEFLRMVGALSPDENPVESRAWRLAWVNRLAITSAWKVVTHDDDPARLGSLDMPVLLVRGADTGVVDQAMTESLAELLPHAETLVLPGGHTSHLRGMDQFLDVFEGFLRG